MPNSEWIDTLLNQIKKEFPNSHRAIIDNKLIQPNFFSPFQVELPKSVLEEARQLVRSVYQIKENEEYQNKLDPEFRKWPKTPSILSSFDFHYSPEMGLKLIEINTNASLYLATQLFYQSRQLQSPDPGFKKLYGSFQKAFALTEAEPVDILDFEPSREGLYFEFFLYQEWLEQRGHPSHIISVFDYLNRHAANIYNRLTDFYLNAPSSRDLKSDYEGESVRFSPNPREYFLMASKKHLSLLREFLPIELQRMIPESKLFSEFQSTEEIWSERKKYFFKPSQSYGSKGVYSGKGISRKAFAAIAGEDFLAQELCPAGHQKFSGNGEIIEMKFDLRFYTFEGEIQNYVARLYQGQATNMRTPQGGLTPLLWK